MRLYSPRSPYVNARATERARTIAEWDPARERYPLTAGTQDVAVVHRLLAEFVLEVSPAQLRVLTYDVGGGFGTKAQTDAESAGLRRGDLELRREIDDSARR